jgi:hypothetical protein
MIHIINDSGIFHFLFLLVAGRYNALLPNGHLRDCHISNGTYRFEMKSQKYFAGFPTNRTRRLKKFVVWAVNGKKLTPC